MQAAQKYLDSSGFAGNAIVIGLGKSGLACAMFLVNHGWDVEVADIRSCPPMDNILKSELPGVELHTGQLKPQMFLNVHLVVMSPSANANVKIAKIAGQYGARIVSSLDIFMEWCERPVVAIAGTNGKSTVAALVEAIIQKNKGSICVGGPRDFPLFDLLNEPQPDVYMLELTSLHLERARKLNADVASILNISPNHLDRYPSVDTYVNALKRIFRGVKRPVVNRDDPIVSKLPIKGDMITFGRSAPQCDCDYGIVEESSNRWIVRGEEKLLDSADCVLQGCHNELNMLAACAIADAAGFPLDSRSSTAISEFKGLPYRCSDAGEWNGVRWINDSRSMNVGAAIAAVQSDPRPAVLIAGGLSKGADFSELATRVNGQLRGCVFYGRDGWSIGQSFPDLATKAFVDDIEDAVLAAAQMTRDGDRVVFSPGCASNDMFSDYSHRGKAFNSALERIVS